jgi:beta-glucanase (GH16 family)
MARTARRATLAAAAIALALPLGVSAASAATPARNTACTAAAAHRMTHTAWVALLRDVRHHYAPATRRNVWRRLTAHPAAASRLLNKWSHGTAFRTTCRARVQLTSQISPGAQVDPGSAAAGPDGVPGSWTLRWSDEFNGSSLDTSKWSKGWFGSGVTQPVDSSEIGAYDPNQVDQSGGSLNITAIRKSQSVNGTSYPYTTGIVTTDGLFNFTYGTIEARIKLDGTSGSINNWPAFWADGMGNWPSTGELDVMEGLDGRAAYHFHSNSGGPGSDVAGNYTGWHTYTADWSPGRVDYYYDGRKVGSITTGITASPMYLILDYAISGHSTGPRVTPDTMQVDYVRVWQ